MIRCSILFGLGIILIAAGCGDEKDSACLDARIVEFKKANVNRGSTGIYSFQEGGQTYYIFDHGIAFDATAEVINSDCEVVCTYGGFRMPISECDIYLKGINRAVVEWEGGQ